MSKLVHAIEEKPDPNLSQIEKSLESDNDHDDTYWDARLADERKLVRKIDSRILPIACLMYLFACKSYYSHSRIYFYSAL